MLGGNWKAAFVTSACDFAKTQWEFTFYCLLKKTPKNQKPKQNSTTSEKIIHKCTVKTALVAFI